jgi:hypothetical protein
MLTYREPFITDAYEVQICHENSAAQPYRNLRLKADVCRLRASHAG